MSNVKLDDEKQKTEKQFLIANNPYATFHRPESDSEQQYDGHMTQPASKKTVTTEDSGCCPCVLF